MDRMTPATAIEVCQMIEAAEEAHDLHVPVPNSADVASLPSPAAQRVRAAASAVGGRLVHVKWRTSP